jgi:hypothetical protein
MVAMNVQQLSLTIDCVYHINMATTIAVYTYCTQYINYLAGIAWQPGYIPHVTKIN